MSTYVSRCHPREDTKQLYISQKLANMGKPSDEYLKGSAQAFKVLLGSRDEETLSLSDFGVVTENLSQPEKKEKAEKKAEEARDLHR